MERSSAEQIIATRIPVLSADKYRVKVTSVTSYHRSLEGGNDQVAIANFNAMSGYHLSEAKALFAQGDYQEATNKALSSSIRASDYMPTKGEVVDIMVEERTTKAGVKGLFVTGITPIKAKQVTTINMTDFFKEDAGPDMSETPAFAKAALAKA